MNVSSLICHRDVAMGIECLGSMARSVDDIRFTLHDDGTLTGEDRAVLRRALPVDVIVERRDADEAMTEKLGRYPACRRARGENVLMLKLLDVALRSDGDIRYCDTDVLFIRPAVGLFESPGRAVFMHDIDNGYAVRPWQLWPGNGVRLPRCLNSGLFAFPRVQFDLDYLEWLLSRERFRRIFAHIAVWAEQTCWAALAFRAGCRLWDPRRIAVVDPKWTLSERTVAAHFVSSARDRLPRALADSARLKHAAAIVPQVETVDARECSAFILAKSQLLRRLRRAGVRL
jgi:hypothetical protein